MKTLSTTFLQIFSLGTSFFISCDPEGAVIKLKHEEVFMYLKSYKNYIVNKSFEDNLSGFNQNVVNND